MKVFKIITLFALITMIVLANSCKVTYPNEKKIIGKWNPVKVEKISPPVQSTASETPHPKSTPKTDSLSINNGKNAQGIAPESRGENQLNQMASLEERTSLEVYSEKKMIVKAYPKKTYKGTWKMKKKGMQVQVKNIQTGEKRTIDLVKINDTSAVLLERFPFGDIKITYLKER